MHNSTICISVSLELAQLNIVFLFPFTQILRIACSTQPLVFREEHLGDHHYMDMHIIASFHLIYYIFKSYRSASEFQTRDNVHASSGKARNVSFKLNYKTAIHTNFMIICCSHLGSLFATQFL